MNLISLEKFRFDHALYGLGDEQNGAFKVPGPCGMMLRVIASSGYGWEHVSVSTRKRMPNWTEMEWVKRRTLGDVVAYQLHLPESQHINVHRFCLHIWRPLTAEIPLPPNWMVA